jgi:hypothetical protein
LVTELAPFSLWRVGSYGTIGWCCWEDEIYHFNITAWCEIPRWLWKSGWEICGEWREIRLKKEEIDEGNITQSSVQRIEASCQTSRPGIGCGWSRILHWKSMALLNRRLRKLSSVGCYFYVNARGFHQCGRIIHTRTAGWG